MKRLLSVLLITLCLIAFAIPADASYPASGYSLFYNGQRNLLGVGQ